MNNKKTKNKTILEETISPKVQLINQEFPSSLLLRNYLANN